MQWRKIKAAVGINKREMTSLQWRIGMA